MTGRGREEGRSLLGDRRVSFSLEDIRKEAVPAKPGCIDARGHLSGERDLA